MRGMVSSTTTDDDNAPWPGPSNPSADQSLSLSIYIYLPSYLPLFYLGFLLSIFPPWHCNIVHVEEQIGCDDDPCLDVLDVSHIHTIDRGGRQWMGSDCSCSR